MLIVDNMTTCHNVEAIPTFVQQDSHFEEYDRDTLLCPDAPKLGFILSPEVDEYTEDDSDDLQALFGLYPEPSPLAMVCPGAPRIPFIEQFERPSSITGDNGFRQCPSLPFLEDSQHADDEDNDNMEGLFGLYPDVSPCTMVCPGAPKLPFIERFEGPSLLDDEVLARYGLCGRSPIPSFEDYHFDDQNGNLRPLFGLYPEPLTSLATHRRVAHVRRDSDEFSSTTSPALSTPPTSEFIYQDKPGKEVELTSDLVIVGDPAIISRNQL
jgi:hypothetical protein